MKLYMHPASTTSRPVMMLAKLADIPLELVTVDILTGKHHEPEYAKINPTKLVPTLDDDGFVLTESSAIMKYLADKVESPLYPKELKARARVNERMDWLNTNFYRDWGYNLIYPQLFPHHARANEEITKGTVQWGAQKSAQIMGVLNDSLLGSNPYLCGDTMTIADLFGAQLMSAGELVRVDFGKYPNVKRWLDSIKALPAWKETNETHEGFVGSLADKPFVAI